MTITSRSAATEAARLSIGKYIPLEQVTRPNLNTAEAAFYLNRRPQTLRTWACYETGPIRPSRLAGQLAWNTAAIKVLAGVAA